MIRKLTQSEVKFTIEIEPEDLEVRGNVMVSGDDQADKEAEDEILARLDRGETEAWCIVSVKVQWKNYTAYASLGGCTFDSAAVEKDLAACVEEHGLKAEALESLNSNLSAIYAELVTLVTLPSDNG